MSRLPIRSSYRYFYLILLLLILLIAAATLFTGRYPKPGITFSVPDDRQAIFWNIMLRIRLPRVLSALLTGAVLSVSGYVFQMLFANPLVEPGFLGVSQGAAFGAASAILLVGYFPLLIQLSAFIFAISGLSLSLFLASRFRFGGWILRLILAGIAVSALFSSGIGILKFTADPLSELQDITYWLLGGLWNADWDNLLSIIPVTLPVLFLLILFRWRINLLSLDDRTVFSHGIAPIWEKRLFLAAATAATAAAISITGLVGWIGLVVPHLARRIVGSNSRHALPVSLLVGSLYMLVCDTLSRSLFSGEIPLGIAASLLGTLLFVVFLTSKRGLGESV